MAHFDIIITLKKNLLHFEKKILMFLKQYLFAGLSHKMKAFLIPFKVKCLIKH